MARTRARPSPRASARPRPSPSPYRGSHSGYNDYVIMM